MTYVGTSDMAGKQVQSGSTRHVCFHSVSVRAPPNGTSLFLEGTANAATTRVVCLQKHGSEGRSNARHAGYKEGNDCHCCRAEVHAGEL